MTDCTSGPPYRFSPAVPADRRATSPCSPEEFGWEATKPKSERMSLALALKLKISREAGKKRANLTWYMPHDQTWVFVVAGDCYSVPVMDVTDLLQSDESFANLWLSDYSVNMVPTQGGLDHERRHQ